MQKLLLFFLLSSSLCFSQHTEQETLTYQENLNAFYQNPETTPLKSDELDEVKSYILNCYEQYQANNLKVYGIGLQYFSRKKLTEKLAKFIKEI